MKKIFLLSLLVILGTALFGQSVLADNASLLVLPATAQKTIGSTFSVNVQLNPTGNKVCVVKGTLVFDNLSCQNISVASGLMAQVTPTCQNPNFTVGIPNCTTISQNILSVSVKSGAVGDAGVSFSGVKVIGAGTAILFNSQVGAYNITAVPVEPVVQQTPEEKPVKEEVVIETPKETQVVVENVIPKTAGVAGLSTIFSNPLGSPILIIFIITILILIGLWVFDKFYLSKKR